MSFRGAKNGLETTHFRGIYWLFNYKMHHCHYYKWKIGYTWKVHVQWGILLMATTGPQGNFAELNSFFCLSLTTNTHNLSYLSASLS